MFYVYVLQGSNGRYYVGYTGNIERRLAEHRRGNTQSTKGMGEKTLIGYFEKDSKKMLLS